MKIKAACQCNPVLIDGELTASEASNKNDETERQDGDVEGGGVALADPGEVETSDGKGCSKREEDGRWVVPKGESLHMGSVGTNSAEQHDGVIERGHSGHYDWGVLAIAQTGAKI